MPDARPRTGFFAFPEIDWIMLGAVLCMSFLGLLTMASFSGDDTYLVRQVSWLLISVAVFFFCAGVDWSFLKKPNVVAWIFVLSVGLLSALFAVGHIAKGAQKWFSVGGLSFQPSDPVKLGLIVILAKYFSRRHVEIANIKHILVSGFYAFVIAILIFLQPDLGSAIIVCLIWLGMILVSGVSKKHLAAVFLVGLTAFSILWFDGLKQYQRDRLVNFIHPLSHLSGSGYNAYQATIAIGSGGILGKGIGYGTQSRLKFLPEYRTDFIFAAFAEEWGLVGVAILFSLFAILIWRIAANAYLGATNFEVLFGLGLAIMFMSHFFVNVGMTLGLAPVTGINFPFMSYGGTNLLASFAGLGILAGMSAYRRSAHRETVKNEFLGLE
ncbi:MAG: rod shape-determining protein RodA [Patescibacteria group bacterium]|nr:rod shape-determining protein RodA [Patescibacteria group bacterium]